MPGDWRSGWRSPGFAAGEVAVPEEEARALGHQLGRNVAELRTRLAPRNLVAEAEEGIWREVDRVTDEWIDAADGALDDGLGWLREHRLAVIVAGLAAAATAATAWFSTRKTTVPLYAAYAMEDPEMMDDSDEFAAPVAEAAAEKARSGLKNLGERASDAYDAARQKARKLSADAKGRAEDAAEFAVAAARDAADAARDAAESARRAAGEAGRWARRQPQENPVTVVLVALAAGALIGALLPTRRRDS